MNKGLLAFLGVLSAVAIGIAGYVYLGDRGQEDPDGPDPQVAGSDGPETEPEVETLVEAIPPPGADAGSPEDEPVQAAVSATDTGETAQADVQAEPGQIEDTAPGEAEAPVEAAPDAPEAEPSSSSDATETLPAEADPGEPGPTEAQATAADQPAAQEPETSTGTETEAALDPDTAAEPADATAEAEAETAEPDAAIGGVPAEPTVVEAQPGETVIEAEPETTAEEPAAAETGPAPTGSQVPDEATAIAAPDDPETAAGAEPETPMQPETTVTEAEPADSTADEGVGLSETETPAEPDPTLAELVPEPTAESGDTAVETTPDRPAEPGMADTTPQEPSETAAATDRPPAAADAETDSATLVEQEQSSVEPEPGTDEPAVTIAGSGTESRPESEQAVAEAAPGTVQPGVPVVEDATETTPEPEPTAAEAEPGTEPDGAAGESVIATADPEEATEAASETALAEPERAGTTAEPDTTGVPTEPEATTALAEPAVPTSPVDTGETEATPSDAEPAVTEAEPQPAEAEPAVAEAEPQPASEADDTVVAVAPGTEAVPGPALGEPEADAAVVESTPETAAEEEQLLADAPVEDGAAADQGTPAAQADATPTTAADTPEAGDEPGIGDVAALDLPSDSPGKPESGEPAEGPAIAAADSLDVPGNITTDTPESATTRTEQDQVTPERSVGPDRPNETGGPTFDVIRVGGDGRMILAGRSEPLAVVIISDGETVIGEEIADTRGDWIFMPTEPLSPGSHQIGATQRRPNGERIESSDLVLVVVPERGTDIAGRETDRADQPLVMLVPREGGPATVIVQSPEPDAPLEPQLDGTEIAAVEDEPEERTGVLFSRPSVPDGEMPVRTAEPGDVTTDEGASADTDAAIQQPFAQDSNSGGDPAGAVEDEDGGPVAFSRPTVAAVEGEVVDEPDVSVGVIDYGAGGDVAISGDAPPGATVQVYLDNAILGVTEAAPSGAWQLAPSQTVPPGPHQIRIDQIAPSGDVIARIELPFDRAAAVTEMPQDIYVVVEPGQSLWRIARRVYGEGVRYTEILAANRAQIADPNLIYPGQVFMIPRG